MIRPLKIWELEQCVPFGQAFHRELQLPGHFFPEKFVDTWTTFLSTYPSVILGAWKDDRLCGGIGGLIAPDLYDGRLYAQELFWFIGKEYRGGTTAIRLLQAFEVWAIETSAVELRVAHFFGEQEVGLRRLLTKLGYVPFETSYYKLLGRS